MTESAVDSARFRQVLGHLPTGVCVVAGYEDDKPVGLAIGSFFSISLDPPLVGFCAGHSSSTWPKLHASGRFCVNILAHDQEQVSRVFASREADKFATIGWEPSPLGQPRIHGSLAWLDCTIDVVHKAGDHDIVVAAVHGLDVGHEKNPLLFFRGGYADMA